MFRIDIKKHFEKHFPWHYDPLATETNDCPVLGKLDFDYKSLTEHVFKLCETQDIKTSGKGWSHYFEDGKVKQSVIESRDEDFKKLFEVWQKANWTLENSCYYEFHNEELGDFYQPLLQAYENKFGKINLHQLRIFVKPPMTALGLHADTYGSFSRKHNVQPSKIFRSFTLVEDWEWGHYNLIGNNVLHQYEAGESYRINPNVFHLSGNLGFNPLITMNITGVLDEK
jgi:hypothetical protein